MGEDIHIFFLTFMLCRKSLIPFWKRGLFIFIDRTFWFQLFWQLCFEICCLELMAVFSETINSWFWWLSASILSVCTIQSILCVCVCIIKISMINDCSLWVITGRPSNVCINWCLLTSSHHVIDVEQTSACWLHNLAVTDDLSMTATFI